MMASESTHTAGAPGQRCIGAGSPGQAVLDAIAAVIIVPGAVFMSRAVQRVLLSVLLLNIPLQIQKHLFLREAPRDLGSLGGLPLSLTNLALAGLCMAWLLRSCLQPYRARPALASRNGVALPGILLVVAYMVSMVVAGERDLALFDVLSVLTQVLLCFYFARNLASGEEVMFVVRVLLIGLMLQSVLMTAQAMGVVGDLDFYGFKARAEFAGDHRISGTLGSPNAAAAYLAMSMLLALGTLLAAGSRSNRVLATVSLALATAPLVFTLSRGGWMMLLVGAACMFVAGRQRMTRRGVAFALATVMVLATCFGGAIASRLSGDDNGSAAARMPLNRLAMAMIEDHPITGVGANNFATAMPPYVTHFTGDFVYTVHNRYLLVWAETGVFGVMAFVWLLAAILREGWTAWRVGSDTLSPVALGCVAAVAGLVVQMNIDISRSGAEIQLLWLFGGLAAAINGLQLNRSPGIVRRHVS